VADNTNIGAAMQYAIGQLGGPLFEQQTDNIAIAISGSNLIVDGNGDRVSLIIFNTDNNDVFISTNPIPGTTSGIRLNANGGFVSMNVRDDFTLPTRRWYGQAIGSPSHVSAIELNRYTKKPTP
jgi:hypothetical protein